MRKSIHLHSRARAASIHLLGSVLAAVLGAALVFALWYPWPYREISGGRSLFVLVVAVDVVMGPLLTLVVFDKAKGRRRLIQDLTVIGVLQLAALGYGLRTVYMVRPVAMVFEVDRFRVITAMDVYARELPRARAEYRSLPLTGPWLLATRPAERGPERNEAIFLGLKGIDTAQRPIFWQSYEESQRKAYERARPIDALFLRYPDRRTELDAVLREQHLSAEGTRFLPLVSRVDWVVLLGRKGEVVGYAPFDGFF